MQTFRTLVAMSFGVGLVIVALIDLGRANGPWAPALRLAADQAVANASRPFVAGGGVAEVAVAFDGEGRVAATVLRRSSGRAASDAEALDAARELASLQLPEAVAGRTVLFHARFNAGLAAEPSRRLG